MKITYIVNSRIPTEKAHGYQICKMCEEFVNSSAEIELIYPTRKNTIEESLFEYYGLNKIFSVKKIKFFDFISREKYFFRQGQILQSIFFALRLFFLKIDRQSIIYTRDSEIAWIFKRRGYKVFYEAHSWPNSKERLYYYFLKDVDGIICNSRGTLERHKKSGLKELMVASNGVDLNEFESKKSREELRTELALPMEKKIVMYVGHLYGWKGVDTIIKAAELMKCDEDILFVMIGGVDEDILTYRNILKNKKIRNVLLLGRKKKHTIPRYLKSADILLLPNSAISTESIEYTSPLKMFEYMASGVPIVASSLPALREVLNDGNSVLVKPDDAEDISQEIKELLGAEEKGIEIAKQAVIDVQEYSWRKRAEKIIKYID
jgi:glycosyltransferase involved in cell wall biosynthesis